jgi:hypothetical protein
MYRIVSYRSYCRLLVVAALVTTGLSCGKVSRAGRGSSFLVIDSLTGIRGAVTLGQPTTNLVSDVVTNVTTPDPCSTTNPCPTVFSDVGEAVMHVVMKDAGSSNPTAPNELSTITVTRYRVKYTRADGRNTPGVDVPHPFDGAVTVTVGSEATRFGFLLVRVQAKNETPLLQLRNGSQFITQIAEVTFWGEDQAGNQVSITGNIQIDFGNYGDF